MDQHPVKYPYMPIIKKLDEIDEVLSYQNISLTGMELIAKDEDSAFFQDDIIRGIKEKELFIWLNAMYSTIRTYCLQSMMMTNRLLKDLLPVGESLLKKGVTSFKPIGQVY